MIITWDDKTGAIQATLIQHHLGLEQVAINWYSMCIKYLFVDVSHTEIHQYYVKDEVLTKRPIFTIEGEVRILKADGEDTLTLKVDPPELDVYVRLNEITVHQEHITDGMVEISSDHAGTYQIILAREFPHLSEVIEVQIQ